MVATLSIVEDSVTRIILSSFREILFFQFFSFIFLHSLKERLADATKSNLGETMPPTHQGDNSTSHNYFDSIKSKNLPLSLFAPVAIAKTNADNFSVL